MSVTRIEKLFLVRTRRVKSEPFRKLSPLDRWLGWADPKGAPHGVYVDFEWEEVVINEGDEEGLLHSLTAPALLTWEPLPGHEILAVIFVHIETEREFPERRVVKSAEAVEGLEKRGLRMKITTCLGRSVMLGEDGAEDAFGHDAVKIMLDAFVRDDDRRMMPVEFEVVAE